MMKEEKNILYELDEKTVTDGIAMLSIKEVEETNMEKLLGGEPAEAGSISIDNKYYTIWIDKNAKNKGKSVNHGFWWNYGTKEGKNKFHGNVLCVLERNY